MDANSAQSTPLTEVARIKSLLEEVTASLQSQRDVLKMRGISLPPMTLQTLSSVGSDLAKLEKSLTSEQTELGQLRSLADSAAMINTSFDMERVFNRAMDVIISLTGAERGYIILVNPNTGELDFRVKVDNEIAAQRSSSQAPQVSQTVIREVLQTGEPLLTDNAYKDERFEGHVSIAALSLRSVLCVPLRYKDSIIGVVYVDNRLKAGVFEQREKNLLAAFANQVAVAIANARLYTDIQRSLAEITAVKELTDNVFESIGSGIITTNATDYVMMFNSAAAEIIEPLSQSADHPTRVQELISLDIISDVMNRVRETNESQIIDSEIQNPSGRRLYTSLKLAPLKNSQQETEGVAMVVDDITEQKERSEMLNIMKRYLPPQMVDNIHTISGLDLGGERREVTCVFADVRPISTLPEGMRPPEVMELVNVYLAEATHCIHSVQGVIDKYMGTEIMGLFNSQLNPMPDHAARAVQGALLIRDAFTALYQRLGINPNPHYYRIGIHTGVATLGNVGSFTRRDFTAIGDTINLAKRLEENATDSQIIISEDTRQHLENTARELLQSIRLEERDPIQVKGRTVKTRIFEVFRS